MFGLKCVVHSGQSVHKFCAQYVILAGLRQCLPCADERLAIIRHYQRIRTTVGVRGIVLHGSPVTTKTHSEPAQTCPSCNNG